jgi:hypothetical protein
MLSLRTLTLTCFIAAMSVLTGCANIQPKMDAFEQQSKRLGVIYAQVNKVSPSEDWGYCDSSRVSKQAKKASCKPQTNAVQVSWITRGAAATLIQGVPSNVPIRPGAIVVLDMSKPLGENFVSVASYSETEACHWSGKDNDKIDSSFKTASKSAGGFLAGALMPIPSVIYLASSVGGTGGVVCNGWNYQEAYKDKDIESLIDIF